jgi:DNA-binding Lrp family transcriptional regulator
MKEYQMKDAELKLIYELMKNSRRSDRDLAKAIGVSQPTVTRIRSKLEKEGYISEYTMIPDFIKLGYQILALTFVKSRKGLDPEEVDKAREIARECSKINRYGLITVERGIGLGYDGVIISYHKCYANYLELVNLLKQFTFLDLSSIESFMISLDDEVHYIPLSFKALANHVLMLKEKC